MIVDCFTFAWELELLECRLEELDSVVDLFVLCEANATFQGRHKPLVFYANRDRFKKWSHKIEYVFADLSEPKDPWHREYHQRDAMNIIVAELPSDALVLNGDVDEIPFPSLLAEPPEDEAWVVDYDFYSMAVDWKAPFRAPCTVVANQKIATEWGMSEMRRKKLSLPVHPGGWHFSWLGGPEAIIRKAASFSHTEDSVQNYVKEMGARLYTEGYHVLGEKLEPVEIDETFPTYIRERRCPETWFRPRQ